MDSNGQSAAPLEVDSKPREAGSSQTDYFGWLKSTFSQSADVWSHIKRDVAEVAQSVAASDTLTAAKGTATSVLRQFADVIHTFQQEGARAEPPPSGPVASNVDDDGDLGAHFSSVKSSFSGFVSALEKGISELTGGSFNFSFTGCDTGTSGDNRDVSWLLFFLYLSMVPSDGTDVVRVRGCEETLWVGNGDQATNGNCLESSSVPLPNQVHNDVTVAAHLGLLTFCPTEAVLLNLFHRGYSVAISGKHSAGKGWVVEEWRTVQRLKGRDCQKSIHMTDTCVHEYDSDEWQNDCSDFACACIEVIRADPATYEQLPSSQKDVLSYLEWRSNFFDENTCCPRPDIPVFEGDTLPTAVPATTTTYPPPSQILEANPIVRNHLIRLVDPNGGGADPGRSDGGSLSETDFWSRYYYRVWCFDVLDLRRTRLAQINAASVAAMTSKETGEVEAWPDLEIEEEAEETEDLAIVNPDAVKSNEEIKLPDTMANSLVESQPPKNPGTEFSSPASSVVMVTTEEAVEANDGDDDEGEDATQRISLKSAVGGLRDVEEREEEDEIQLSVECLQEEAAKLRAELGSGEDDKSEAGSDWDKWS
ncbi:unnamed protein product [Taenia asiatica]|uniref:BSD domain-containing protein n=1 Tax=Taenia asiatica TaxID=60517 RepID=A0A0R3WCA5_TAEAS|nr:unnamed protein product [Taenia asiatica]